MDTECTLLNTMKDIHLAWCCDDTYARHMGVAICSALENLSKNTRAHIFIVSSGLGGGTKHKITEIIQKYNAAVHFIDIDKKHFAGLKISHYISPAAYFRITLPDLLPGQLSKVLYLDCDLIVKDDLTVLHDIDISDTYLGAVAEADQGSSDHPRQTIGIPQNATYFNSGVLLINLEKWRQDDISKKLFDFIKENPHRIRFWDQDALNIFFHDTFKQLDSRWNFTVQHLKLADVYNSEDISIVHFIGGHASKPWYRECNHPLKDEYYKYLNMTPWRGCKPTKIKTKRMAPLLKKMLRLISLGYSLIFDLLRMHGWNSEKRIQCLNFYLNTTGYMLSKKMPPDFDSWTIDIISKVRPFTQTSIERISELCNCVKYIVGNNIPGVIVECGVWKGGSIMAIIYTLIQCNIFDREIYLFDTFESMSKPTDHDRDIYGVAAQSLMNSYMNLNITLEEVQKNVLSLGYPAEKIHFIKGKVEDTLPAHKLDAIALLRLDTDWYESTLHELNHLFPNISKSGVLIIDDYGHFSGCRKAVDEYISKNKLKILLNRVDYTCRCAVIN